MKIVLLFSTICLSFLMPMSVYSADTVSGVIVDSVNEKPLEGVKVLLTTPYCSTYTDKEGAFLLAIPISVSVIHPAVIPKSNLLDWQDEEVSVIDLRGCLTKSLSFSSGFRVLRRGDEISKVMNLNSSKKINHSIGQNSIISQALFKTSAVTLYTLSAKKEGYNPVSKSVSAGQPAEIKLVPKGTAGNFNVSRDSIGVINIKIAIKDTIL